MLVSTQLYDLHIYSSICLDIDSILNGPLINSRFGLLGRELRLIKATNSVVCSGLRELYLFDNIRIWDIILS